MQKEGNGVDNIGETRTSKEIKPPRARIETWLTVNRRFLEGPARNDTLRKSGEDSAKLFSQCLRLIVGTRVSGMTLLLRFLFDARETRSGAGIQRGQEDKEKSEGRSE